MRKAIASLVLLATLVFTLTACSGAALESIDTVSASQPAAETGEESSIAVSAPQESEAASTAVSVEYDADDLDSSGSSPDMSYIKLQGDSIAFEGSGATVSGTVVTITSAGTYSISGILNDGQIIVDTVDEETVVLVLNGADIACSTSAPIYVSNAEKTVITLADGTENHATDGASYVFEEGEDEPNAAVFSKDDLTINGNGSLTVDANYNNGIASKDDLKITGGTIIVNAVNDGIKGRDSIAIRDGMITIVAGGDGMQSNNDEDAEKGYISIEGGTLDIKAGKDGIQAETRLVVSGGRITISSGGGSINGASRGEAEWGPRGGGFGPMPNNPTETSPMPDNPMENNFLDTSAADSAKGLKAGVDVTVSGGTINIDSADDAIHSNDSLTINGGDIVLASGDDGLHADSTLEINGGELSITKSYEGIESAVLTFNDGNIHIVASDDGINAAGGTGGFAMGGGPGAGGFESSTDYHTYINGGYIYVDATGDGIDSNGPMDMSGGVVLINGPTSNNNGALDCMSGFDLTGGFLVAVGSSGMAQGPSETSTQYSVMYNFESLQVGGTPVHIETEGGQDILTFVPAREYQSIVMSSPELENGATYVVYSGGGSTGTVADGLYSGGTYSAGTEVASFTISSMVTSAGSARQGFRGGGRPDGGPDRPIERPDVEEQ
jgi:hypothetical protein